MTYLFRAISAEAMKLRRTLAFWLLFVAPAIIAALNSLMYIMRSDAYVKSGEATWANLTQNEFLLWTLLMLPLFVTLEAALMGNLEHGNGGFKQVFALPVPRSAVYSAKLITNLGMFAVSTLTMCAFVVVSGLALQLVQPQFHFNETIPALDLLKSGALSYLGSWLIISFHTWVSLRWNSFVVAIATGSAATVASVLIVQSDYLGWYPWTIPAALSLPQTDGVVMPALSLAISLGGWAILAVFGCWNVIRRDVL
jgi:lantibiotic transport system permease protein